MSCVCSGGEATRSQVPVGNCAERIEKAPPRSFKLAVQRSQPSFIGGVGKNSIKWSSFVSFVVLSPVGDFKLSMDAEFVPASSIAYTANFTVPAQLSADIWKGNRPPVGYSIESFSGNLKVPASTSIIKCPGDANTDTDCVEGDGNDPSKQDRDTRFNLPEKEEGRGKRFSPPGRRCETEERRDRRHSEYETRCSRDRDDNDYEPDKEELWSDYLNEEDSESSESDEEYSRRNSSKIDPYRENNTRSPPQLIDEFEGLTDHMKEDEYLRGVLFRQIFEEELYGQSTTMPMKVPYPIMKKWFLRVAWSESAKRARCNHILSWTRSSVGVTNIDAYLQIINKKLIECEVSSADHFVYVTQKALMSYVCSLRERDFDSPRALNVALSRIE
ncbi:hypothetical protein V9T40_008196 [Parthenolecanium corni]|uniref:Uncharacterized protein n=1 Tax=Parthenolecanium corni TaxID=536013 RepID=A0AAN9TRL0_9HEMI